MKDICLKCGQCCKLPNGNYCRYFDRNSNLCKIYNKRLGAKCQNGFNSITYICKDRLEVKKHYPNCPYNDFIKLD